MKKAGPVLVGLVGLIALVLLPAFVDEILKAARFNTEVGGPRSLSVATAAVPALIAVIVAAALLFKREAIGLRLFGGIEIDTATPPVQLLRVAVIVLGIYMVATSIPMIPFAILSGIATILQFLAVGTNATPWYFNLAAFGGAIVTLLELAVGWLLIAKSDSLSRKLWSTGTDPALDDV